MCGIAGVVISTNHVGRSELNLQLLEKTALLDAIKSRGPDGFDDVSIGCCWLCASVLHIQGEKISYQPYSDEKGVLCWNGEVFSGLQEHYSHEGCTSDTVTISKLLGDFIDKNLGDTDDKGDLDNFMALGNVIVTELSLVEGPYAFIYYHKSTGSLFFGRDPFGRRSLLQLRDQDCRHLMLSSVLPAISPEYLAGTPTWSEVPISGIFGIQLNPKPSLLEKDNECITTSAGSVIVEFPWPLSRVRLGRVLSKAAVENAAISATNGPTSYRLGPEEASRRFLSTLQGAVGRRVKVMRANHSINNSQSEMIAKVDSAGSHVGASMKSCRIGVLFSGGIDSVLLAAVLHLCLHPEEPIDLMNVSFQDDSLGEAATSAPAPAPDRLAAIAAVAELKSLFPLRDWRLVHIDVSSSERQQSEDHVKRLISPLDTHMDLNIGTAFWFAARGEGYLREYSDSEVTAAQATSDSAGRPLVRLGGEDAARSVGLKAWTQRQPGGHIETIGDEIESANDMVDSAEHDDQVGTPGKRKKGEHLRCANSQCRRVGKRGCFRGLCKKCCNTRQAVDTKENRDHLQAQSLIVRTTDAATSEEEPHIKPSPVSTCSVHKFIDKACDNADDLPGAHDTIAEDDRIENCNTDATESPGIDNTLLETVEFEVIEKSSNYPLINDTKSQDFISSSNTLKSAVEFVDLNQISSIEAAFAHVKVCPAEDLTTEETVKPQASSDKAEKLQNEVELETISVSSSHHICIPPVNIDERKAYRSSSRALLVGIGADEQMAGYGRHRTAYLRGGDEALERELSLDCERLWQRNLGRDDRCVADSGREAWFPFIDEQVVALLQSLHLSDIANLREAPGVGDKRILRDAAKLLGLKNSSMFVKRAIQFGTRIAKHTNVSHHGSNRKGKGTTKL